MTPRFPALARSPSQSLVHDLFELHGRAPSQDTHAQARARMDAYLEKETRPLSRCNRLLDLARALPNPKGATRRLSESLEVIPALDPLIGRMQATATDIVHAAAARSNKVALAQKVVQRIDVESLCSGVMGGILQAVVQSSGDMNGLDLAPLTQDFAAAMTGSMYRELLTPRYAEHLSEPSLRRMCDGLPLWSQSIKRLNRVFAEQFGPCVAELLQQEDDDTVPALVPLSPAQEQRFQKLEKVVAEQNPGCLATLATQPEDSEDEVLFKTRAMSALKRFLLDAFDDFDLESLSAYYESPEAQEQRDKAEQINMKANDPLLMALIARSFEPVALVIQANQERQQEEFMQSMLTSLLSSVPESVRNTPEFSAGILAGLELNADENAPSRHEPAQ